MNASERRLCKRNIEDLETVLRYIDYFDYGFSKKSLNKKKKKLTKYKEELEKKLEEE